MKTCSQCKQAKPLEEFQKRASNKDGYAGSCKECKRKYDNAHYAANPDRRQYIRDNSERRAQANKDWLYQYLTEHTCVDCDETDPVVMEFDHQGDKEICVSLAVQRWSLARLQKEIAKCVVRCANCHRRKTARDFGFWKLSAYSG